MKPHGRAAGSCLAAVLIACSTDAPVGPGGDESAAFAPPSPTSALAASECRNVRGSASFELANPETARITGDIEGTFTLSFVDAAQRGRGALHALFLTDFHTNLGDFSTSDRIVLPPPRNGIQTFNSRRNLQAPDAGFLQVSGSFATEEPFPGSFTYHGRVCVG